MLAQVCVGLAGVRGQVFCEPRRAAAAAARDLRCRSRGLRAGLAGDVYVRNASVVTAAR